MSCKDTHGPYEPLLVILNVPDFVPKNYHNLGPYTIVI